MIVRLSLLADDVARADETTLILEGFEGRVILELEAWGAPSRRFIVRADEFRAAAAAVLAIAERPRSA